MLVPLCPGILLGRRVAEHAGNGDFISCFTGTVVGVLCACVMLCLYLHVRGSKLVTGRRNILFGVAVCCFFFLFGLWRSASAWREVFDGLWDGERVFHAVLTEVPRRSERAVTAEALVAPCRSDAGNRLRRISLVFMRDTLSECLAVGDKIVFCAELRVPANKGNPEEFDYAEYLAVKGISGQVFLPSGRWRFSRLADDTELLLPFSERMRIKALMVRDRMLAMYRAAGLQGEELALLSALTLGEKSGLSSRLRDLYAETGVSHLLALSGMHLGFLMLFFHFLFVRCGRQRALQCCVGLLSFLLMWTYVFVAGLPASLVRAAAMYTLMWTAVLLGRKGISFNVLLASAFIMLCIRPPYLYDIGFQLSFLAMVGILTVFPVGKDWKVMRMRWTGWLFRSIWFSFSAQLFTVPLALYYFGMFSPYSIWATLIVSPLTAVLLSAMPLLLLSGWLFGVPFSFVVPVVKGVMKVQDVFLQGVSSLPFASLDADVSIFPVLSVYVLLLVLLARPLCSKVFWLKAVCGLFALFMIVSVVENRRNALRPCIIFYNNPSCPAVHVVESSRRSWLFTACPDCGTGRMSYIEKTFWKKKLSVPPVPVAGDYNNGFLSCSSGLVAMKGGVSFLMLYDGRWDGMTSPVCADVDYILLCHGYEGNLPSLARLFRPRCIVLDASLRSGERKRYKEACRAIGWRFYDMEIKGALKVALK